MGTTNPDGRITRRGFIEGSSAALANAGLIGNAYAGTSALSSESTAESVKPDVVPLVGKIALEEHFVLAENIDTSYAVRDLPPETRHKILDVGTGRIAEMDRGAEELPPFVAQVKQLLAMLAQRAPESDRERFASRFYLPFFAEMNTKNFVEPFLYWSMQRAPVAGVREWLTTHQAEVREFVAWSKSYKWPQK